MAGMAVVEMAMAVKLIEEAARHNFQGCDHHSPGLTHHGRSLQQ
jgi:hypothetical protein